MSLLVAALLSCAVLTAQEERAAIPDHRSMDMTLEAVASDASVELQVRGAHEGGLVVVLYGGKDRIDFPLPGGLVLEVNPFGVLAWGEGSEQSWEAEVAYDNRYSAGLKFRLQAFSLQLGGSDSDDFGPARASHSIVIQLPEMPGDTDAVATIH